MKHSRGTYSAVIITALTFGDEKLPHGTSTTVQKISSSPHAYNASVISNYPSKPTMNNGVLGYLCNTKDIISSMT